MEENTTPFFPNTAQPRSKCRAASWKPSARLSLGEDLWAASQFWELWEGQDASLGPFRSRLIIFIFDMHLNSNDYETGQYVICVLWSFQVKDDFFHPCEIGFWWCSKKEDKEEFVKINRTDTPCTNIIKKDNTCKLFLFFMLCWLTETAQHVLVVGHFFHHCCHVCYHKVDLHNHELREWCAFDQC